MTTYIACFRTEADFAMHEFEAGTPELALALARQFYEDDSFDLAFEEYGLDMPVNEIAVTAQKGGEPLAEWLDGDLRLRLAARDLLEAAELVIARWERGDLAAALRNLDAALAKA